MLGRFGITSVYAVMTLHTAEMFPTEIRNSVLGISSTCAHIGGILAPYVVDILVSENHFDDYVYSLLIIIKLIRDKLNHSFRQLYVDLQY